LFLFKLNEIVFGIIAKINPISWVNLKKNQSSMENLQTLLQIDTPTIILLYSNFREHTKRLSMWDFN